ncbi:hypothetical protein BJ875DRAFT_353634, partial [Amylocarpus encephaloides]
PCYNNLSVIRGMDLNNLPSIRLLLSAFNAYFTTPTISTIPDSLSFPHRAVFDRITFSIQLNSTDYPLLRDALEEFSKVHDKSDEEVRKTIVELQALGEERVLLNPSVHWVEYDAALRRWEEEQGYVFNSHGEIVSKVPRRRSNRLKVISKNNSVRGEGAVEENEDEVTDVYFSYSPVTKTKDRETNKPTATDGWTTKVDEVGKSRWMKEEKGRGTEVQPPWSFFANIDILDGKSLKRIAQFFDMRIIHKTPLTEADCYSLLEFTATERREVERMYAESRGNRLLTEMLWWYAQFHTQSDRKLTFRARALLAFVTSNVRHPHLHKVEYAKEMASWKATHERDG